MMNSNVLNKLKTNFADFDYAFSAKSMKTDRVEEEKLPLSKTNSCKSSKSTKSLNKVNKNSCQSCSTFFYDRLHKKFIKTTEKTNVRFLLLEYCPNMELFDYIFHTGEGLGEDLGKFYFKQLLEAIHYLHNKMNMAHRDIKPENMFLDENFNLKLGDFGFSKLMSNPNNSNEDDYFNSNSNSNSKNSINFHSKEYTDKTTSINFNSVNCINNIYFNKTRTIVGTQGYESPELLEGRAYCPKKYDVFSCGVALFLMVFGVPPFKEAKKIDKYYKYIYYGKEDEFWNKYSKLKPSNSLKKLISSFLVYDPSNRISIEEALGCEWLNSNKISFEEVRRQMSKKIPKILLSKTNIENNNLND